MFIPLTSYLDRKLSWCLILWTMNINGSLSETNLNIVIGQDKGIAHKFFLIHLKTVFILSTTQLTKLKRLTQGIIKK